MSGEHLCSPDMEFPFLHAERADDLKAAFLIQSNPLEFILYMRGKHFGMHGRSIHEKTSHLTQSRFSFSPIQSTIPAQVGIHERSAREKISHVMQSGIAHIMNDEATRKYFQGFKRLITFVQVGVCLCENAQCRFFRLMVMVVATAV